MLKTAVIVLSLAYPVMVYWGLQHYDPRILLPILAVLLSLRWLAGGKTSERKIIIATLIAVIVIAFIWGEQLGLKFYPVMMNLGFLTLFGSSLISPPTVVERLARLQDPDLPPHAVAYTRKVTLVWSVFFLINGSIAAFTALFSTEKIWMLYNGFIAYILIGILAAGEWITRQRIKTSFPK